MGFDEDTARINSQIAAVRTEAEPVVEQFLRDTVDFLCDWSRQIVEKTVTSNPEKTKQLGKEGLSSLKNELAQLTGEMPEHVKKHLNLNELWLHRGEIAIKRQAGWSQSPYEFMGNSAPERLNTQMRVLLGYAGSLLVKFGFAGSDWTPSGANAQKYRYSFDWSDYMRSSLHRYAEVFNRLSKLAEQLESVKRQKAEAEAKQLWDQA